MILRGEVRIQRSSIQGREYALHDLGPGQCFNLVPTFDGGTNMATVVALTDVVIYSMSSESFRGFAVQHQAIAAAVMAHLALRVRRLSDTVESLALHSVRTRLARCLLSSVDGSEPAARYWTQDDLAVHVGTVRDVVGRALRSFASEGLIRRERGRLVVLDLAGLKHEAMRGA
jgi:CRP/FNR family transcriptional regulator